VCKVADLGTGRLISELNDVGDGKRVLQTEVEGDFLLIEDEEQVAERWRKQSSNGNKYMTALVGTYPWMAPEGTDMVAVAGLLIYASQLITHARLVCSTRRAVWNSLRCLFLW